MTGLGSALATFPNFVVYFVLGGVLTTLFVLLYARLTPQRDITLIRAGNSAAAITLVGALLGFVVPLASVIAHSPRWSMWWRGASSRWSCNWLASWSRG